MDTSWDLGSLQTALDAAPFHRWLGLKVVSAEDGALVLEMPWRDEIVSNPRIPSAHGGVLASLVDLTGFYVLLASGNVPAATVDLRVDYHKAATPGPLRATGKIIRLGSALSVAEASITNADGALLSSGRGAYQMTRR